MDHTAIKFIQDTAAANYGADQLIKMGAPAIALPKDFSLHSLEKYRPSKNRFTGHFVTSRTASFVAYHLVHGASVDLFVDPSAMSATAIYDLGDKFIPGHCEHSASLTLQPTAELSAYMAVVNNTHSQRFLAEWIEDWRDCVTAIDEDDATIPIKQLISTIRNITIEGVAKRDNEEGNFSSKKTAIESVEAKSSVGKLPKILKFTCVPYKGLPGQSFAFRLSIKTGTEKPSFSVYRVQGELEDENTAEAFCQLINGCLGGEARIYHGKFNP